MTASKKSISLSGGQDRAKGDIQYGLFGWLAYRLAE